MPALGALTQQTGGVLLKDVVGEWMRGKQKEWEETRLVTMLDSLEQQQQQHHQQDEQKDGSGGSDGSSGLLKRTVSTMMQLLTDYNTLRQSEEKVSQPHHTHTACHSLITT